MAEYHLLQIPYREEIAWQNPFTKRYLGKLITNLGWKDTGYWRGWQSPGYEFKDYYLILPHLRGEIPLLEKKYPQCIYVLGNPKW